MSVNFKIQNRVTFFDPKLSIGEKVESSFWKMQHDEHFMEGYEEIEFDSQTQARLDNAVDKLLKGYDWTLAPLAQK